MSSVEPYGAPVITSASTFSLPATIVSSSPGPDRPSPSITIPFAYFQIYEHTIYPFQEDNLANASFRELCPSGNCINDCANLTRLFQAVPDGIIISAQDYGKPQSNELPDVTLFGVCSNLANLSFIANSEQETSLSAVKPFFANPSGESKIVGSASKIATCFADTCDMTRHPDNCTETCARETLLFNGTKLDIEKGISGCLQALCNNTCGLPYANQDVFGIGILVSYAFQAALVLSFALTLGILRLRQCWNSSDPKSSNLQKVMKSLNDFLIAQCYFGISISTAGFVLNPGRIDPLTGYALLSVAMIAFLPTTFTLMLLHSHGFPSWRPTFLTLATWLISTVLFFRLLNRLYNSKNNTQIFEEGLQQLFHQVNSCGGSSAMALCQQAHGINPLKYLTLFYNQGMGLESVITLWALSSFILFSSMIIHLFFWVKKRYRCLNFGLEKLNRSCLNLFLVPAYFMFGGALIYLTTMVKRYFSMDVIDKDGWNFGQVVAVLAWVPSSLDFIYCISLCCVPWFKKHLPRRIYHVLPSKAHTTAHFFESKRLASTMTSEYRPLGTSTNANWSSQGHASQYELLHAGVDKLPLSEHIELREESTRETIETEEA